MEKTIDKILQVLMNSADFVSGESIGNDLGISRIAVNKQIKKLIGNGVNIEVGRKGYKYVAGDTLTQQTLTNKMSQFGIDIPIFVEEVVSTNTEAKCLYPKLKQNFLFVAPRQISGKGRLDRTFVSASGGVYMTLCYKPKKLLVSDSLKIVLLTGLAVAKTLKKYAENVKIKWPNDVFLNGKKVCGILLESVVTENMTEAIFLGIGVNLSNEIPDELQHKVTSFKLEGLPVSGREQIICEITRLLFDMLARYQENGFDAFYEQYAEMSMTLNQNVSVNVNGEIKTGFAVGLSEEGYLLLDNGGVVQKIILGDIEV